MNFTFGSSPRGAKSRKGESKQRVFPSKHAAMMSVVGGELAHSRIFVTFARAPNRSIMQFLCRENRRKTRRDRARSFRWSIKNSSRARCSRLKLTPPTPTPVEIVTRTARGTINYVRDDAFYG